MKQNKIIIVTAFFTLCSFMYAGTARANDSIATVSVPVELRILGTFRNLPLLQLDFTGTKEENEFSISITDENGIELYSADVKGENFSKQFLLNTADLGDAILNFVITGKRSGKSVVYVVNPGAGTKMNVLKK